MYVMKNHRLIIIMELLVEKEETLKISIPIYYYRELKVKTKVQLKMIA